MVVYSSLAGGSPVVDLKLSVLNVDDVTNDVEAGTEVVDDGNDDVK